MGTIIGVIVGYALGTRAGDQGWEEFKEAWKTISTSQEVRDLMVAGLSVSRELLSRAAEVFTESIRDDRGSNLRPVA